MIMGFILVVGGILSWPFIKAAWFTSGAVDDTVKEGQAVVAAVTTKVLDFIRISGLSTFNPDTMAETSNILLTKGASGSLTDADIKSALILKERGKNNLELRQKQYDSRAKWGFGLFASRPDQLNRETTGVDFSTWSKLDSVLVLAGAERVDTVLSTLRFEKG